MTWDELFSFLTSPFVVSVVTSLVVALVILGLDKLLLAPRADKRRYELSELEKRLDAYGELVAVLKATKKKREAVKPRSWGEHQHDDLSHYLEQHDIKALDKLFGEKARLMSRKLIDLWISQLGQDPRQLIEQKRQAQRTATDEEFGFAPDGLYLDLREMEPIAESEYRQLTEDWEALARIKLNK